MSSVRKQMASRANGALSHGPKTPEGKAKSSHNAVKHNLLSKIVVTDDESRRGFDLVFGDHFNTFNPTNGVELGFAEVMASTSWRLRRLWAIEKKLTNDALRAASQPDEETRLATAFNELVNSPGYLVLHRYATSLDRSYQRAFRNMLLMRKKLPLPNEPI